MTYRTGTRIMSFTLVQMKLQQIRCRTATAKVRSGHFSSGIQGVAQVKLDGEQAMSRVLNRKWMSQVPDTQVHQILVSPPSGRHRTGQVGKFSFINNTRPQFGGGGISAGDGRDPFFYVVRDDLLHPLVNGNKARKLDALLPLLADHAVTDVVTCGGCQSAHAAAVAVSSAERGLKSHLLLRGEQPQVLTGYNLISTMYGLVNYVPRSVYADREKLLKSHADLVAGEFGTVVCCNDILEASLGSFEYDQVDANTSSECHPKKVVIFNEGAGDTVALLGVIRLVEYLCQDHLLGKGRPTKLVIDAGTGTTAIGLGLGALCLGLPWEVNAIMLADTIDGYKQKEKSLISDFRKRFGFHHIDHHLDGVDGGLVCWVDRCYQRKFGKILEGETETCKHIAQQTGILVDPVYTLAAWELATQLSLEELKGGAQTVMLHTGGTLGMFGLAQRYKSHFSTLKDGIRK